MNIHVKRTLIAATAVAGLVVAGIGGAYIGRATVPAVESASSPTPASTIEPCNLRLVWDRTSETYDAVYEDFVNMSLTGEYGPVTNPSCTDDEIIQWRDARIAAGKPADVCRPVVAFTLSALPYFSGCAVPTMVVSSERR